MRMPCTITHPTPKPFETLLLTPTTRSATQLLVSGVYLQLYPTRCFFKLQKSSAGKWWFVDPNGKPLFSLGIDTITFVGDTTAALRAKYGNQSNWADNVVRRLRSWNLGA